MLTAGVGVGLEVDWASGGLDSGLACGSQVDTGLESLQVDLRCTTCGRTVDTGLEVDVKHWTWYCGWRWRWT